MPFQPGDKSLTGFRLDGIWLSLPFARRQADAHVWTVFFPTIGGVIATILPLSSLPHSSWCGPDLKASANNFFRNP